MRALLILIVFFLSVQGCAALTQRVEDAPLLSKEEHMRLAAVYEAKGEEGLALREYRRAARADATDGRPHFAMGNIFLRSGRLGEAEESFLRAIELDPGEGAYYNNLAWVYMETGDLAGAERAARTAIEKGPGSHAFLDTLGVVQIRSGDYSGAEETFRQALESVSGNDNGRPLRIIYGHMLELYERAGLAERASEIRARIRSLEERGVSHD